MLLQLFVGGRSLIIAIMESILLVIVLFASYSWGARYSRAKIVRFLEERGQLDLAAEYLRYSEQNDDEALESSSEDSSKGNAVPAPSDGTCSTESTKAKEYSVREKLTEEQRKRIPEEAKERTHQELADQYGVSRQYISRLCKEAEESKGASVRSFWRA